MNETEKTERFYEHVLGAIREALEALGASSILEDQIITVAKRLSDTSGEFCSELSSESSFYDFAIKAKANLVWLKPYGVSGDAWAKAAIQQPQLFYQKPETLRINFESNLEWLKPYGVSGDAWAKAAIQQPPLFCQKPETLRINFESNLEWLKPYGVSGDAWAKAAIQQPPLFCQKPETLRINFESNLEWLKPYGVSGDAWAKAAIQQPSLFYQKPETLRINFESNLEWLKPYGVSGDAWAKAAIQQPQLFCQKPETLRINFESNLEWLKPYGVSGDAWAKAANQQPSLFCQKPETLRINFESNLEWLKPYGVSGDAWAKAAIQQPQLFCQKPETLRINFELVCVVCEMPAFKLRQSARSLHQKIIDFILSRPAILCLAESNMLLRVAFAEITRPEHAASLLKDARGAIENRFMEKLGFSTDEKIIPCGHNSMDAQTQKAMSAFLKKEMSAYAALLREDWRLSACATEPRMPKPPILDIWLPERGPDFPRMLAETLVLSGLIHGYKLPTTSP